MKKILVISLSNIGDIVLTFPVIDILKRDFPQARLDIVLGPLGKSLVSDNPVFNKVYIYDKKQPPWITLKWILGLAVERYDLVVDLRNTAIPFMIFPGQRTPLTLPRKPGVHMRQQHLSRLKTVHNFQNLSDARFCLNFSAEDKDFVHQHLAFHESKLITFAPGSRSETKRWREDGFAKLGDMISSKKGGAIVIAGDDNDAPVAGRIKNLMTGPVIDLTGKLNLNQLAYLISISRFVIANDSAPLHLASYMNVPVIALFGPTDPGLYGPWGDKYLMLRKNGYCPACRGKKNESHRCMNDLDPDYVTTEALDFIN